MSSRILLVDDDAGLRRVMALALRADEREVREAGSGAEALELLDAEPFDCVVADLKMPGMDGIELMEQVHRRRPDLPYVLMTAHGTVDTAVTALKQGAYDYLAKPVANRDLRKLVDRAVEHGRLKSENRSLRSQVASRHRPLGQSPGWLDLLETVERVAHSNATLLFTGESGTGKEILARHLHNRSDRAGSPFVAVNCAALPADLLESELFGHAKGAFTGADKARSGRFRKADGGTLLLDEIGELPVELQAKLLRVLQEKEVDPVGGGGPIRVDVRVVAATNADLEQRVEAGDFRSDLYFRLAVLPLRVPPLRERPGDASLLFVHFLSEFLGNPVRVEPAALELLERWEWPGNVRELRNVAERVALLGCSDPLTPNELDRAMSIGRVRAPRTGPRPSPVLDTENLVLPEGSLPLEELERAVIVAALDKFGGNKSAAARYLDVERHILLYRLKKFGIG